MIMTVKEAHALVMAKFVNFKAIKCVEYDTRFVFQVVPSKFDASKSADRILDCLYSVDKSSGEVKSFQPFHIPVSEYRNGKVVSDFA